MNISKIKYKNSRVEIHYETPRSSGEADEYILKCGDAPKPSFEDAWQALPECIAEECELPSTMIADIKASGVTISAYDDGRWGVVLVGSRTLDNCNAPMNLISPHKPNEGTFDGDDKILSDLTINCVEQLITEAEAYIKGDRAQGALDLKAA